MDKTFDDEMICQTKTAMWKFKINLKVIIFISFTSITFCFRTLHMKNRAMPINTVKSSTAMIVLFRQNCTRFCVLKLAIFTTLTRAKVRGL